MSPSDLKAIVAVLATAIGYFLVREFTRKDKIADDLEAFKKSMDETIKGITQTFTTELRLIADRNTQAIESLKDSVSALSLSIADQKAWFAERYVYADDHEKAIQALKEHINANAERFEKELKNHRELCPAMKE